MDRQIKNGQNCISEHAVQFIDLSKDKAPEITMKNKIFKGTALLACLKGKVELTVNGKKSTLSESELMTILPMQEMKLQQMTQIYDIKVLLLSNDFLSGITFRPDLDLIKEAYLHPNIILDGESRKDITTLFEMALKRNGENTASSENIQKALALSILTIAAGEMKISTSSCEKGNARQGTITKTFIDMLLKNFHHERSTAYYAERLCVTSKYLCTAVKSATGHTIQEWTNELTANEAKRLLCITDNSVKMISEALNFSTPAAFIRFFRKNAGLTPLEYRRRNIRD